MMIHGTEQDPFTKSNLQLTGIDGLLNAVGNTLGILSRWGCRGFSCSDQTLVKLKAWTACPSVDPQHETLNDICAELEDCQRCALSVQRRHILFGQGSSSADLVFVRQMPSAEEDQSGHYYQGPAGQLLLKMIGAMKMTHDQVYICNLVKCRGSAEPADVQTCLPFLKRQLRAINPKVICTLGEGPSQILLDQSDAIAALRGQFFNYVQSRIMPTLDPAFLLDHPEEKKNVWQDLKKIMAYLGIAL